MPGCWPSAKKFSTGCSLAGAVIVAAGDGSGATQKSNGQLLLIQVRAYHSSLPACPSSPLTPPTPRLPAHPSHPPAPPCTQRKNPPFAGRWALPGGFVDEGEPLEAAAARELQEETSVDPASVLLTQVGAFGDPGRDPRGWCVSVAFAALVPSTRLGVKAADDAAAAQWFPISQLPPLAFDHKLIVRSAFRHLASQLARGEGTAPQQQQPVPPAVLRADLEAAADALEGPWQQQQDDRP